MLRSTICQIDLFRVYIKNGSFSVNFIYRFLVNNGLKVTHEIWQMKILLKNKIFMWFLKRGVILTKDNLARRNWNGSKVCCFLINLKLSNIFSLIVIMLVFSSV